MTELARHGLMALFALLLCSLPVRADKRNPVEKLAADAADAYRAGEYRRATDLLERAYKLEHVSALLYNMAKAYEKLGDNDRAADLYTRYAAADDADPRLRGKAEARVTALHEPPAPKRPPREEPPPRTEPQPKAEPQPKPEPVVHQPVEPPPPKADPDALRHAAERSRKINRGVGLALVAIGACTLGAAIGLSVNALRLNTDFKNSTDEIDKKIALTDATSQALAADLLYGVTAAAVGVSIYFLYKGFRPEPKALSLAPSVGPGGAGLVLEGVF